MLNARCSEFHGKNQGYKRGGGRGVRSCFKTLQLLHIYFSTWVGGICSLALFGLDRTFNVQVNVEFFTVICYFRFHIIFCFPFRYANYIQCNFPISIFFATIDWHSFFSSRQVSPFSQCGYFRLHNIHL